MALDDYMRQMQSATMQNAMYENEKYRNMGVGLGQQNYRISRHPFEGVDLAAFNTNELQDMIEHLQKIYDQKTLHTPLWAPTRFQCNQHESIGNAHKELCLIKKLVGL